MPIPEGESAGQPPSSSSVELDGSPPMDRPAQSSSGTAWLNGALSETAKAMRESSTKNQGLIKSLQCVALYHRDKDVMSVEVAADIVKAVASTQLPSRRFEAAIDRWSGEIAHVLMRDLVGERHLREIWRLLQSSEAKHDES